MKFVISYLLVSTAIATPIKVFHESMQEQAEIVRTIFMNEYKIPEELIVLQQISECEVLKQKGKLDVCLKKNGDLFVVSVDRDFINESLKVFRTP